MIYCSTTRAETSKGRPRAQASNLGEVMMMRRRRGLLRRLTAHHHLRLHSFCPLPFLLVVLVSCHAISYPGGLAEDGLHCLDICSNISTPLPPGGWTYALLDQLYLPQFCRDLEVGIDSTVSHQNVEDSPQGLRCLPQRVTSTLTIHGLWPSSYEEFLACCRYGGVVNVPVDALQFNLTHPDLLALMGDKWVDPTTPDAYTSLCQIYNHEFQKHGYCLGGREDLPALDMAADYFRLTLEVASRLDSATAQVGLWGGSGYNPQVEEIRALYLKRVQVYCARRDGDGEYLNRLSALRTCWGNEGGSRLVWIDCEPEEESGSSSSRSSKSNNVACDSSRAVLLTPYSHGQASTLRPSEEEGGVVQAKQRVK